MAAANPKFVLRNHLAQSAIAAAEAGDGGEEVRRLLEILRRPFDEQPDAAARYSQPAPAWSRARGVATLS